MLKYIPALTVKSSNINRHVNNSRATSVNRASLGLLLSALMLGGLNVSAQAQDSPTQSAQTQDTQVQSAQKASSPDQQAAAHVLDLLNQYSSDANWDKYFALYRKDGIFIGTDAKERWGMAEFEHYSRPTKGWRYDLTERHLIQHGDVILFDELLNSPAYGVSRGTGTLIKTDGNWKIAQYHLSFPIPNEIAKSITAEIKAANKQ
ncbi:MAG: nuclear transport factor 2 family protein [Gammaproteobacteria bacterium]|nr:nuclear transport factor 2 family protein [Gammaproteobacteria bacterium]MBU1478346.1 nuclear transport factor 2 family protein [Gammaproteobacteria bacterium]MBU2003408.1 nuclear transport factor 2 family protein [Gammaproteobacteria bacterium]MBU2131456.1 nuclear transport factor 2 family protein [Gammaproteobacteria bacterium]MBU2185659.1 nuclear transport factor 2 family protein [Gammaproteobacteria bacterium]